MPEGPEVRRLTNFLNERCSGKIIKDITCNINVINNNLAPLIKNNIKINSVRCKGKFIYFELNFGEPNTEIKYLGNHLGMNGDWGINKSKYTILEMKLEYKNLYFSDARKLSKFYFLSEQEQNNKLASLGPDVMTKEFSIEKYNNIISNIPNKMVSSALIDQNIMSGIGNYLRADILYMAKIHPKRKIKDISSDNIKELYKYIKEISYRSYKGGDFIIYGKDHDALGNKVEKINISRTMWYVPSVQIN